MVKKVLAKLLNRIKREQTKAAYQEMAEDLFQDYYAHRHQVYKMNFIRGVFFGFGSVLGGTVVVAIVIWILSLFVNFPLIGEYLRGAEQTLQTRHR